MASIPVSALIDHTLLKPTATGAEIAKLCAEAKEHQFATVCVNPAWIAEAKKLLKESSVKVCTVVGFPLGANTSEAKALEARNAVEAGADEIDMVINIGKALENDWTFIEKEIRHVKSFCSTRPLKVIFETCYLTNGQIMQCCHAAKAAKADFVKTSTGFGTPGEGKPNGATAEIVRLMRETVGPEMGVKASGGVRTYEDAQKMIAAGATRLGTSAGVAIVKGAEAAGKPLDLAQAKIAEKGKSAASNQGAVQAY